MSLSKGDRKMEFKIKYFKDYVPFHVGDEHHPIELNPRECPGVESEEAEVRRALENPIDSPKLREIVHPGEKIVIVTSDVTRPMPSWVVVPCVLDELEKQASKTRMSLLFSDLALTESRPRKK